MLQFLDDQLGLMAALATGGVSIMSSRCSNIVLQYMTHAMGVSACYKHLAEHWDGMLANVAFPMMAFNDQDQQLWEEDPQEYVRMVSKDGTGRGGGAGGARGVGV